MSMYVSDCTNVYADDSEGYLSINDACANCFNETITDLGPPVAQCPKTTTESYQKPSKKMDTIFIVVLLLAIIIAGVCAYSMLKKSKKE